MSEMRLYSKPGSMFGVGLTAAEALSKELRHTAGGAELTLASALKSQRITELGRLESRLYALERMVIRLAELLPPDHLANLLEQSGWRNQYGAERFSR